MRRFILSSVDEGLEVQRGCPYCGRNHARIHSGVLRRAISDLRATGVMQRRMKCSRCARTWTVRGAGVEAGHLRSRRLKETGVLLYMLGLSYRGVEQFLAALGCRGSSSAVERDVAAAGAKARALHLQAPRMRVRVLGVDGTGAAMAGRDEGVLFFVDVDRGRLVGVEAVGEDEARAVRAHVERVMAEVGAVELRTDEHRVYEGVLEEGRHRLCLTHWRKSKGKRCADLYREALRKGRPVAAGAMRKLLGILRREPRERAVPGDLRRLLMRYIRRRGGLDWQINQLLQHVERTWTKVSDEGDPTNNATERVIGLNYKIRSKTMRGFKSRAKALSHAYLSAALEGMGGVADLRKIV